MLEHLLEAVLPLGAALDVTVSPDVLRHGFALFLGNFSFRPCAHVNLGADQDDGSLPLGVLADLWDPGREHAIV